MTEIYNPSITVFETPAQAEACAAGMIIDQVRQKPGSVLTLPTGSTPIGIYGLLVAAHREGSVDFGRVTSYNLDEYWPLASTHPSSYNHYMNTHFFNHVNIPHENRHIPNGEAPDAAAEAARYGQLVGSRPIDLGMVSLGPGRTCHIGFNEPGSALDSRVRYVPLEEETKAANRQFFEDPETMPEGAITQGVADILAARHVLLVATGTHKAWGVRRSLQGEVSSEAPGSFLRCHANVSVILDAAAASLLQAA